MTTKHNRSRKRGAIKNPFIKPEKGINTVDDFRWHCEDKLTELLDDLMTDSRYSYELDPDDDMDAWLISEGASKGYHHEASKLWENMRRRYVSLGEQLYPEKLLVIRIIGLIE